MPQTDDPVVARFLARVGAGDFEEVQRLLAAAPQLVNAVGPHPFWGGRPQPLHVAVETTRRRMVDLLLDAGADVNGANEEYDHWSPLMLAINRAQPAIQQELIRRGAHVGLFEALMLGDDERAGEWLARDGLPAIVPSAGSILSFARTTFAIDRLVELGAPVDVADRWGTTPIAGLSRLGAPGQPLVRHLISRGAAARPEDYARVGDRETLASLIAADPAILHDESVVMGAVDSRHHALVEWLLANGAPPNARARARSRHTALHSAAWNGDLTMVKLLLGAGADPRLRDEQYDATPAGWAETAITVTACCDCREVAGFLRRITGEPA